MSKEPNRNRNPARLLQSDTVTSRRIPHLWPAILANLTPVSMIRYAQGNLLETDADALVNAVNTVGVMGKGIALMFKQAFPGNFRDYAEACKQGMVQTGRMFVTERHGSSCPRWIINFPTKQHWRSPSRIEWIRDGLGDLRRVVTELGVRSLGVPPLGCGHGGLEWSQVQPLIELALGDLAGVEVTVFAPIASRSAGSTTGSGEKGID